MAGGRWHTWAIQSRMHKQHRNTTASDNIYIIFILSKLFLVFFFSRGMAVGLGLGLGLGSLIFGALRRPPGAPHCGGSARHATYIPATRAFSHRRSHTAGLLLV